MSGRRLALALLVALGLAAGRAAAQPADFYVATDGDDAWSGRLAAPAADGTDGPFATLERARDAARGLGGADAVILVREGTYPLAHSLVLSRRDDGLTIAAWPGERPVLLGGAVLADWTAGEDGVLTAPLPATDRLPLGGLDLFVGGVRQTLARTPNRDPADPIRGGWLFAEDGEGLAQPNDQFRYARGDMPDGAEQGWVSIYSQNGWDNNVAPVRAIDRDRGVVTLRSRYWFALGEGSRYFLFDLPGALDAPGEWQADRTAGLIRYIPDPTVVGATELGILGRIVQINGARGVTLRGLTIRAGSFRGDAVSIDHAEAVTLERNLIEDVGTAIMVRNSTGLRFLGNEIRETAGFGIRLEEGVTDSLIENNHIHGVGRLYKNAAGIWLRGSSRNRIAHNLLEEMAKFAIGGGSIRLDGRDASFDNVIEYNEIRNANLEASDGGAIMLIGWQRQSSRDIVRYNRISGTSAAGNVRFDNAVNPGFWTPEELVSWAIYLDDWASGITVEGNLLVGNVGGVQVHAGWDNQVIRNIVADGTGHALTMHPETWVAENVRPSDGNLFLDNILLLSRPESRGSALWGPVDAATFSGNVYWGPGLDGDAFAAEIGLGWGQTGDFADWQEAGLDRDSRIADPGLADGFAAPPGSLAAKMGFGDLPLDRIGLTGPVGPGG